MMMSTVYLCSMQVLIAKDAALAAAATQTEANRSAMNAALHQASSKSDLLLAKTREMESLLSTLSQTNVQLEDSQRQLARAPCLSYTAVGSNVLHRVHRTPLL